MIIFPAIDLYKGEAVRLHKGNYNEKTVYDPDPINTAKHFYECGARHMHMVDLEGARDGGTPNFDVIKNIVNSVPIFIELGGGIRSFEVIEKYLEVGVSRLILGTAAVKNPGFTAEAVKNFGNKIAIGVDIKDGCVAVKGWTETSNYTCFDFCEKIQDIGVKTIICTDISKDGAMQGTNRELYKELIGRFDMNIIASGGVSSMDDVIALSEAGVYGAIIGKAYYTGAIDIAEAVWRCEA